MSSDLHACGTGTSDGQGGVGLVLSGGGAKGAYHAGVLRALNDMAVPVGAISGASIGALNGAIVAAAPSQTAAADHLQELWTELANIPPLHIGTGLLRVPAYFVVLAAFGQIPGVAGWMGSIMRSPAFKRLLATGAATLTSTDEGILSNKPIQKLIDKYLPDGGLPNRLPLYVSLYPTEGVGQDLLRIIGASAGMGNTRDSEFLHVQSLPLAEQKKALLASAALPILYAPEEIGGKRYSDGGQGGWRTTQGNTPITPLLEAGYQNVVVTHLEDGSFWNRHRFPNATVIEIRPAGNGIARKGAVRDVLGFDNQLIPSWMEQGYEDTMGCIGRIKDTLEAHAELATATQAVDRSFAKTGQQELENAMRRLDG